MFLQGLVGLWLRSGRQPPDAIHGIFDTYAADVHPFGRSREFGRVPPLVLLTQMKPEFPTKHDQQVKVLERSRGCPYLPRSPNVDDETPRVLQNPTETLGERPEPFKVSISVLVTVRLLANQPERWRRHDEVNAFRLQSFMHETKRIAVENSSEFRAAKQLRRLEAVHLGVCAVGRMICVFGSVVEEADVLANARETSFAGGVLHFRTFFGR
jgi:hypothetical protein